MAPEGQRRAVRLPLASRGGRTTGALRVIVSDERGRRVNSPGLGPWLSRIAPARAHGIVGIVITGDARIRALNRRYRGIDRVTDVLSFPSDVEASPLISRGIPRLLGDIVIARGIARRQAREAGHSPDTELRVLALHGLLHLLGYDHEDGSGRMARMERKLRRKGGLEQGLIERAGRR